MIGNEVSRIFFDASFIGRLRRVDRSCELLEFFALEENARCIVKADQYAKSPCNHHEPACDDLDELYSDEDAITASRQSKASFDFSRIAKDTADVKIFLWAYSQ